MREKFDVSHSPGLKVREENYLRKERLPKVKKTIDLMSDLIEVFKNGIALSHSRPEVKP